MTDDIIKSESELLTEEVIQKAAQQGYLTFDELLVAFPEAEENMAQLEEIFIQLNERGIEVYGDDEEAEEERRLTKESLPGDGEAEVIPEIDPFDLSGIAADDTISLYLKEMARVPLLAPPEETSLAKRLERGRRAQRRLERDGYGGDKATRLRREVTNRTS